MAKQAQKSKSKKTTPKPSFTFSLKGWKGIALIAFLFFLLIAYLVCFRSNVKIKSHIYYVNIPPNSTSSSIAGFLKENEVISSGFTFKIMTAILSFDPSNQGGLYKIEQGWSNYQLIDAFKNHTPLPSQTLKIPKVKLRNSLLNEICKQTKLNKSTLQEVLKDSLFLDQAGQLNKESVYSVFIPREYIIPQSISEKELIEILYGELIHLFIEERSEKLDHLNLSPEEVVILASIVYSETKNVTEMPLIAGVYINRLRSKMKLEADPTLVYASGDHNTRRVYKKKKLLYPEYNTYDNLGLPPGPVHFPPLEVIDQVLNYNDHDYYYFCAKADTTGCHSFATTFEEHRLNADKFHQYLNSRKIR